MVLLITIIGFYFMLAPEHANNTFKVPLRTQTKLLIFMFAVYGMQNAYMLLSAASFGMALVPLIFLVLDIFLIKLYLEKL